MDVTSECVYTHKLNSEIFQLNQLRVLNVGTTHQRPHSTIGLLGLVRKAI